MFPVVGLDADGQPKWLRGHAFAASRDGTLVTCRHVVEPRVEEAGLAVVNIARGGELHPIESRLNHPVLDLALLSGQASIVDVAVPLLLPLSLLKVGSDIFTGAHFSPSGLVNVMETGVFKGHVVGYRDGTKGSMNLSYAVIEGLSGAPVLSYTSATDDVGATAAGICVGSEALRVQAYEVLDVDDDGRRYRETVHRIVELGHAYTAETIRRFLEDSGSEPALPGSRV
jgi:hypothetical protein